MRTFLLSQFIQTWLLPPGLFLLILLLGFIVFRRRKILFPFLFFAAIVYSFSIPLTSQALINSLQYQYWPIKTSTVTNKNASAIVILSGGEGRALEYASGRNVSPSTLERIEYSAFLYKKLHIPIVVSGGNLFPNTLCKSNIMGEILKRDFNIPTLFEEDNSLNTKDQSVKLLALLKKYHISTIYIVTHAWHMPRTMYIFNKNFHNENINIVPAPMGYVFVNEKPFVFNFLPSMDALTATVVAIHEYVGLAWYHLIR